MLSEKEFIQLIQQHQPIIHKVCNMYMDTAPDREDLFQEIMISAWKGSKNFRGDAKFSTWLYRVALNTAITFFKKGRKQAAVYPESTEYAQIPDEQNNREAQLSALTNAINDLNEIDKALIVLYLEDIAYPDIAVILGISANNVAVKMNRVKARLKESSKKYL